MPISKPDAHNSDVRPSEDVLYRLLSDKRRRYTVHFLKQRAEPVSVQTLAEQVAAWENEKTIPDLTAQERKRVYIALYQSHLSTLDTEGVVNYDADAGMVSLAAGMDDVEIYLEIVPRESIPWSIYYTGLTVANALLLLLTFLDIPPFTQIPELGLSIIVLVTFGVSAFVQLFYTRRRRIGDEGPPPEIEPSQ